MSEDRYEAAHLEQALAEDPEVAELGLRVTAVGGRLHLRGEVASPERRERACALVRELELEPDREVVDEVTVTPPRAPEDTEREVLS